MVKLYDQLWSSCLMFEFCKFAVGLLEFGIGFHLVLKNGSWIRALLRCQIGLLKIRWSCLWVVTMLIFSLALYSSAG